MVLLTPRPEYYHQQKTFSAFWAQSSSRCVKMSTVYAPKSSDQQLDIIRFLVASGADPSALSSNGTPVWAMGSKYLNQLDEPGR